jgi:release factor glutamine methyltransferase
VDLAQRSLSGGLRAPLIRALWRRLLWWHFVLLQRHRHDRLVLEVVAGRPIVVLPQVLNPKLFRTGEFLAQTIDSGLIPPEAIVLDMGTGSGIGAIAAAHWARRVVAVDINPAAVRCARINALLNQVEERVEVLEGDLFASLQGQRFDIVLFNPPYLRGTPRNGIEQALWATDVVERFAAGLRDHLTPDGAAFVLLSSVGDTASFLETFRTNGLAVAVMAERDLLTEVLTIYRLSATDHGSPADGRRQAAGSRRQTADGRRQTADYRRHTAQRQAAGGRPQTAGGRRQTAHCILPTAHCPLHGMR